jgi:hypothetical protein
LSLLRQIQDATDNSSLPSLLRKCKVLAARLGNNDFKRWIELELTGYPNKDSLPAYRVLNVNSKGHFYGSLGSQLRNADIPLLCMPGKLRESLAHSYLMQSVAEMESLTRNKKSEHLQEPWSPSIVAYFGQNVYQDMNCVQAWKVIPVGSIVAALDSVRTRVLDFVLEIEAQNPLAGEAELNSNPVPMDKVNQIFNTHIVGNVQNLVSGGSNIQQTAKYVETNNAEVFSELIKSINSANLSPETTKPITDALTQMQETKGTSSFKKHYQTFMSLLADHMQVLGPVVAPLLPALSAMLT